VWPGRDADPSPPPNAEVKNRVEVSLLSLKAFMAYDRVKPTYKIQQAVKRKDMMPTLLL